MKPFRTRALSSISSSVPVKTPVAGILLLMPNWKDRQPGNTDSGDFAAGAGGP
jgi:hypothetical protein